MHSNDFTLSYRVATRAGVPLDSAATKLMAAALQERGYETVILNQGLIGVSASVAEKDFQYVSSRLGQILSVSVPLVKSYMINFIHPNDPKVRAELELWGKSMRLAFDLSDVPKDSPWVRSGAYFEKDDDRAKDVRRILKSMPFEVELGPTETYTLTEEQLKRHDLRYGKPEEPVF